MPNPNPDRTKIEGYEYKQAEGITVAKIPISCKFSVETSAFLKTLRDKSKFIREAVEYKRREEGKDLKSQLLAIASKMKQLQSDNEEYQKLAEHTQLQEAQEMISNAIAKIEQIEG